MSEQHFPEQSQNRQPGHEDVMRPAPEYIAADYRAAGKLSGRCAVITGGDSGIGRAVAVHYAAEGANVLIAYLDEHDDADETVRLVEAYGVDCDKIAGDIGDSAFCQHVVDRAIERWGRVNILVNNAAEQYDWGDVTEISDEQLHRTFATNIYSHFYVARAVSPHLGQGDVIIATSSVNAFKGNDTLIDYSATKGAIQGLVRSLAQSLVGRGNASTPLPPARYGHRSYPPASMQKTRLISAARSQ